MSAGAPPGVIVELRTKGPWWAVPFGRISVYLYPIAGLCLYGLIAWFTPGPWMLAPLTVVIAVLVGNVGYGWFAVRPRRIWMTENALVLVFRDGSKDVFDYRYVRTMRFGGSLGFGLLYPSADVLFQVGQPSYVRRLNGQGFAPAEVSALVDRFRALHPLPLVELRPWIARRLKPR